MNSLYSKYEQNSVNFNKNYIKLLEAGGTIDYKKLLKNFDLNPKDKKFLANGYEFN